MAWLTELIDDTGTLVGSLTTGTFGRVHVMPDGGRCPMPQAIAWCRACARYVAAERVPSVEEIDGTLAAAAAGGEAYWNLLISRGAPKEDPPPAAPLARLIAHELSFWPRVREWRLLRRSPARCLMCLSTAIEPVPRYDDETTHPMTGQRLQIRCDTHLSMGGPREYSAEGIPYER